jgi:hypothetical protein
LLIPFIFLFSTYPLKSRNSPNPLLTQEGAFTANHRYHRQPDPCRLVHLLDERFGLVFFPSPWHNVTTVITLTPLTLELSQTK